MEPVIFEQNRPFILEALGNGEFDYMEAVAIGEFRSWSSCTVPLTVVANRKSYADGHHEIWFLIDTKDVKDTIETQQEYHLRPSTEERYRQLKCFSDLTHFTSHACSMVVNQIVFIMLAFNLLQIYLLKRGRKELNQKTLPRIAALSLPLFVFFVPNTYQRLNPLSFNVTFSAVQPTIEHLPSIKRPLVRLRTP